MAPTPPQRLNQRQIILLGITVILAMGVCAFVFFTRPAPAPAGRPAGTYTAGIARAELGDAWPLSVDEGTLVCYEGRVVTFRTGGQEYAVNGTASGQAERRGWRQIRELSVPAEIEGMIKNLQPLVERGLALCS